jgi:hypothetical protein
LPMFQKKPVLKWIISRGTTTMLISSSFTTPQRGHVNWRYF